MQLLKKVNLKYNSIDKKRDWKGKQYLHHSY